MSFTDIYSCACATTKAPEKTYYAARMHPFTAWLTDRFAERGIDSPTKIARAIGVSTSTITRPPKVPSLEVIRATADALHIPVRDVLVAAGYMSEDEALPPAVTALRELPSGYLLDELRRRLELADAMLAPPARFQSDHALAARHGDPDDLTSVVPDDDDHLD